MRLYGSSLYGTELYNATKQEGVWEDERTFTYTEGTTVYVTVTAVLSVAEGATADIYIGELDSTAIKVTPGVRTPIIYTETLSGTADMYIRVELSRNSSSVPSPFVTSLDIDIEQDVSLYTIASTVLRESALLFGSTWTIDEYLQLINVPYSIFNNVTHYAAMSQILQASGAYMYQDRYGVLTVAYPNDFNQAVCQTITNQEIYDLENRSQQVTNRVIINVAPLVALAEQVVWQNTGTETIQLDEIKTYEIRVTDYPAVIDGYIDLVSTGSTATIESEEHLSWGARVTIEGGQNDQELTIKLYAKPLEVQGQTLVDVFDDNSIRANGESVLSITDNGLTQVKSIAEMIASDLLADGKDARRDADITWRGNPCLVIGDCVTLDSVKHSVQSSEYNYNGALRVKQRLRRVV